MRDFLIAYWWEIANFALIALAIWVAVWRIMAAYRSARERSARSAWREYNKMALEYPLLAYPDLDRIRQDPAEYERYEWFVAFLIEIIGEILTTLKRSPLGVRWEDVARAHLSYHWRYLESDDYDGRTNSLISGRLKRIIDEAAAYGRTYHQKKHGDTSVDGG